MQYDVAYVKLTVQTHVTSIHGDWKKRDKSKLEHEWNRSVQQNECVAGGATVLAGCHTVNKWNIGNVVRADNRGTGTPRVCLHHFHFFNTQQTHGVLRVPCVTMFHTGSCIWCLFSAICKATDMSENTDLDWTDFVKQQRYSQKPTVNIETLN